ncbi:hypothetical protein H0H93_004521 [Arthromyces matolae]|nr:hypothetical protein H0H93_004521 [Arthromyces matolae]
MPARSSANKSTKSRSVADQLQAIVLAAIREASAQMKDQSSTSSSSVSPLKRKDAPGGSSATPETPSPKKIKTNGDGDLDTPVLRALASLVPGAATVYTPTRPSRTRVPSAKAAASMKQTTIAKKSSLQRVVPAKGSSSVQVPVTPPSKGRVPVRYGSVISISSDDDDDLPPAPKFSDLKPSLTRKSTAPSVAIKVEAEDEDEDDIVLTPRKLFDDEAVVDNDDGDNGDEADDEATMCSDAGSLEDFIVPDDMDVEDEGTSNTIPPPRRGRRARKNVDIVDPPVLAPSPDIFSPAEVDDSSDASHIGETPADALELATVIASLIKASCELPIDSSNLNDNPYEVIDENVMRSDLQNMHMRLTYNGLCILNTLFEIIPYGYDERQCEENPTENGEFLFRHAHLNAIAKTSTLENLMIDVKHLCSSDARRLALVGEGPYCINVVVGVVSECNLIDPVDVGTAAYPKPLQRRIAIILPQQEERRAISTTCEALNLAGNPKGFYSYHGWAFVTNGEKEAPVTTSHDGYHLPKPKESKSDPLNAMFTVTPSKKKRSAPQPGNEFAYATTNFNTRVPILDGRAETGAPFRFTGPEFDSILSWRPYERNKVDVPKGSVVAVGYTVNHYTMNGALFMPTYVKFVMVLNTPVDVVGINAGPSTDELGDKKGKGKGNSSNRPVTRASTKGKARAT